MTSCGGTWKSMVVLLSNPFIMLLKGSKWHSHKKNLEVQSTSENQDFSVVGVRKQIPY